MKVLFSVVLLFTALTANAVNISVSTADNLINPGTLNQGWWSDSRANFVTNDNYLTGYCGECAVANTSRGYFTFDLSGISGQITSATLSVMLDGTSSPDPVETITLFDVSTDAAVLGAKGPINTSIFDDLGTGTAYGSADVTIGSPPSTIVEFELNAAALADINAGLGGYFSIGAALTSLGQSTVDEYVYGFSNDNVNTLTLTSVVPIPASIWLFITALGGLGGLRRIRSRGR